MRATLTGALTICDFCFGITAGAVLGFGDIRAFLTTGCCCRVTVNIRPPCCANLRARCRAFGCILAIPVPAAAAACCTLSFDAKSFTLSHALSQIDGSVFASGTTTKAVCLFSVGAGSANCAGAFEAEILSGECCWGTVGVAAVLL